MRIQGCFIFRAESMIKMTKKIPYNKLKGEPIFHDIRKGLYFERWSQEKFWVVSQEANRLYNSRTHQKKL